MKRIYLLAAFTALLLATSCDFETRDAKMEHAAATVTDFYMHLKNHEYDSAMRCSDLDEKTAPRMSELFGMLAMEIHDFRVDSVTLDPDDTMAHVHITVRTSNAFADDTVETTPSIPCVKTRDGWRVNFDF